MKFLIYIKNKKIFYKLKKVLPKYICSFPVDKNEIYKGNINKDLNLKKIVKIVHFEIRKKMKIFKKKQKIENL